MNIVLYRNFMKHMELSHFLSFLESCPSSQFVAEQRTHTAQCGQGGSPVMLG